MNEEYTEQIISISRTEKYIEEKTTTKNQNERITITRVEYANGKIVVKLQFQPRRVKARKDKKQVTS